MTALSEQAIKVLEERYFDKDENNNIIEDWGGLSSRVAKAIAAQESRYGNDPKPFEELFFDAIYNLDFMPNSPTLFNAGSRGKLGLLSACFVQIPEDSIDSIMKHAWYSAKLFQAGAGVGYNFSNLRESGAMVRTSMRPSSGAISFMYHIFNSIGEVVRQGGRRRAAMMGLLADNHPEIIDFITFKNKEDSLVNFNISIATSDSFMKAVESKSDWDLTGVTSGNAVRTVNAYDLFMSAMYNNWLMAEPGMIWLDNINRKNPLYKAGYVIKAVNPCSEATLLNFENCCLGSVNLVNHIRQGPDGVEIDWNKLERTVRIAVRFLDDVVDANKHIDEVFERASKMTRRIGVGVTGFADVLVMMDVFYGSPSSYRIADEIGRFINRIAVDESSNIAREKGPYPLWGVSAHKEMNILLRNVSLLAIAPEGSRSIITGTSPSIEPNFGRIIVRTNKGIGSGVIKHPLAERKAFVTTYEVPFDAHIKMQSIWQSAIDEDMVGQAISKTNNAPADVDETEIAEAYLEAWRLGCKGLTVYRDGSRDAVYYEARDGEVRDENGRIVPECSTGACDVGMVKANV